MNLTDRLKLVVKHAVVAAALWFVVSPAAWGSQMCFESRDVEAPLEIYYVYGSADDGINVPDYARDSNNMTRFSTNVPGTYFDQLGPVKFLFIGLFEPSILTGITIDWFKSEERKNNFEVFGIHNDLYEDRLISLFKGTSKKVAGPQRFELRPMIANSILIVFYGNDSKRKDTQGWMSISGRPPQA